ncbi:P-loop containing nucleoside triphosphate hydrolase protein [Mycena leptocephala]|nr:P-loop containing nucleoside triphosphate hydrolase protein [Mycena leptocephala]
MEHPMNSYCDLDFLVDPKTRVLPAKTFVYYFRARGLVRPYNASMSREYRDIVMQLFHTGIIWILVCTDAAGMGCDLPDIDIVMQWKVPTNMSSWIQQLGRAARGLGREGLAVMLVEKTAFEVNAIGRDELLEVNTPPPASTRGVTRGGRGWGRGGRGQGWGGAGRGHGKDYARGSFSGKDDKISQQPEPEITANALGEGLYIYIQSTMCRRAIQAAIFQNKVPNVDSSRCCDLCNPCLFDRTRPPKPIATTRQ